MRATCAGSWPASTRRRGCCRKWGCRWTAPTARRRPCPPPPARLPRIHPDPFASHQDIQSMGKTLLASAAAAFVAALASPAPVQAGEGMWVPQQLPEISQPLKRAGLKLRPEQLADLTGDPLGAVVSL